MLPIWTSKVSNHVKNRSNPPSPLLSSIRMLNLRILWLLLLGAFVPKLIYFLFSWSQSPSPPPFLVKPSKFLPPPPLPPSPSYYPPAKNDRSDAIPNVVHYVYGYKSQGVEEEEGELLPYYSYLAIRSAIVNLQPDEIHFHYKYKPRGPFWDLLEPHLTLLETPAPDEIYGRKLEHFAHKSDVIRLQALQHTGGIYLDIDVFVTRSFAPLLPFHMVMAMEASPNSDRPPLDPEGLCNAVILSRKGERFLERWLESYKDFDGGDWAGLSVRKPWALARRYPNELTVLNERAFFWPLWEGSGTESRIRYVHEESLHSFEQSGQFTYHAWESLAMNYLGALTPESVRASQSSFGKLVQAFVTDNDDVAYEKWRQLKGIGN
ncbi:Glycosyltransferase, DXD sugar-binding motif [Phaffia rhodozyma]|uniref:Glycosyltransferase, DXD sugar-binding motif n=1 Tax=Phaffia rhodozyma TaxID=264483 RepID=A0A0F7SLA7_PHARH|nr:Glycosyltransferase, DXD sugar-binding motif [Phaffia rhodozyma]